MAIAVSIRLKRTRRTGKQEKTSRLIARVAERNLMMVQSLNIAIAKLHEESGPLIGRRVGLRPTGALDAVPEDEAPSLQEADEEPEK